MVEPGWNRVVGSDQDRIMKALDQIQLGSRNLDAYGDGRAAERIVKLLSFSPH